MGRSTTKQAPALIHSYLAWDYGLVLSPLQAEVAPFVPREYCPDDSQGWLSYDFCGASLWPPCMRGPGPP